MRFRTIVTVLAALLALMAASLSRADDPWTDQEVSDSDPVVTSEDSVDRAGSDLWLMRFNGPSAYGPCAFHCRNTPRCGAYTFVRATFQETAPLCYLKEAVPAESPDPCCVSGVVGGAGSNAATPATPARPLGPAGSYDRAPGRYEGASASLINQLSSSDRRWPRGVLFDVSGCEAACDNPGRFTGSGSERCVCVAYSFMQPHEPHETTCTTFETVPPMLAPDNHTMSGRRR